MSNVYAMNNQYISVLIEILCTMVVIKQNYCFKKVRIFICLKNFYPKSLLVVFNVSVDEVPGDIFNSVIEELPPELAS